LSVPFFRIFRNPSTLILLIIGATVFLTTPACGPRTPPAGIDTLWTRVIGGIYDDQGQDVKVTTDGGYIVAGFTRSIGAGGYDMYVIKFSATGAVVWDTTYGGAKDDQAYAVEPTADGGYAVCGFTNSHGAGIEDVYLIKTDAGGDTVWTRTYGGTAGDAGYDLKTLPDSGFIIAGVKGSDVYLIRTDANGDTVWTRTYGGSGNDFANSLIPTADGGYAIAGATNSYGAGESDVYLIKVDAQGNLLWSKTFGGAKNDWGSSIVQTPDHGLIIAGYTESFGHGAFDIYLIRTDANGDTVWTRTIGGDKSEGAYSVCSTADGSIIIAGFTESWGNGGMDLYLVKTGSDGNQDWSAIYGGSADDIAYGLTATPDGGFIAVGYTKSFGLGSADVYILKTAPE
jgi:hypothetical protein